MSVVFPIMTMLGVGILVVGIVWCDSVPYGGVFEVMVGVMLLLTTFFLLGGS